VSRSWIWAASIAGLALVAACATGTQAPPATPTTNPLVAMADASATALRATREREDARATSTAVAAVATAAAAQAAVADRLHLALVARDSGDFARAIAEAEQALALQPDGAEATAFLAETAPTATAVAELRRTSALASGFGLRGKAFQFCSGGPSQVHFDGVVEEVRVTDEPGGGFRLAVVVRASNVGRREASTGLSLLLMDERGRAFAQAGVEQVNSFDLAREFSAEAGSAPIRPGFTARVVWPYIVAGDVERLSFAQTSGWPCDIPGVAFVPTAGVIAPTRGVAGVAPAATPGAAQGAARGPQRAATPAGPVGADYGLVGQKLRVVSSNNQPFDVEVERVDKRDGPQGGLRLILVTRVTNPGTLPTGTDPSLGSELRAEDERGRRFPAPRVDRDVNLDMLAKEYDAKLPSASLPPGQSARQIWSVVVAPDVQRLSLVWSPNR
jgi:hypothetical protein